ncbi:hypothetical protein G9F32_11510 [Acinetobacter sp. 194]|uniref:hypothetical protein n=1 Tax=Acinetobacter shaoyimingii TaxID=2715164 RepID=UPI00140D5A61|nr:hypothetical protein [Acinetobacter shaoyimingii]NHB58636.1 hypothetical protein [Acinetobacter shaoyimingii]
MLDKQINTVEDLQQASLAEIRKTFLQLSSPDEAFRVGFFRASFIGPFWLRKTAHPSLALTGLPNWLGKQFKDPQHATNILNTAKGRIEKYVMSCLHGPSKLDGQITVYLDYGMSAPMPWRWVRDELRVLNGHTLLCMTIIDLPILRHFPMPFLLSRES